MSRRRRAPVKAVQVVAGVLMIFALGILALTRLTSEDRLPPISATARPDAEAPRDARRAGVLGVVRADPPTPADLDVGGVSFSDVTEEAGLSASQLGGDWASEDLGMTAAAAVADVFGTGRMDVFVSRLGAPSSLYRNNGNGTFTDVAAEVGVAGSDPVNGAGPAVFADLSGKGCPDLYVTGARHGENALYVNDCRGTFTEMSAERGLVLPPPARGAVLEHHGVTVADYDRDGDLDLLVLDWDYSVFAGLAARSPEGGATAFGNVCQAMAAAVEGFASAEDGRTPNRSRLFRNDGSGHFEDVTDDVGLDLSQVLAFTGQFVDVTGDGWDDLLVTGDACTSRLFRNVDGQHFEDVTAAAGVATDENGMGSVVRDVDGDGQLDWFVTSIGAITPEGVCDSGAPVTGCSGNRLYRNRGDGTFEDATDRFGLRSGWWGWGAAVEDFSGLGRLEVVQTNGHLVRPNDPLMTGGPFFEQYRTDPMRYWVPHEDGYVDAAPRVGLTDQGQGRALIPFDYDGDGDLDLLITRAGESPLLYRNDRPADRGWLTVRLEDRLHPGNRRGLGARIVVTTKQGTRPVVAVVTDSGSYESQKPPEVHVGLGPAAGAVALVEVWWPGASVPQELRDVAPNQVLTVVRG